jgi:hypothetical protein
MLSVQFSATERCTPCTKRVSVSQREHAGIQIILYTGRLQCFWIGRHGAIFLVESPQCAQLLVIVLDLHNCLQLAIGSVMQISCRAVNTSAHPMPTRRLDIC